MASSRKRVPNIGSSQGNGLVFASSPTEMTVCWVESDTESLKIKLETEPSVLAIGTAHVAAVLNNTAWFYSLSGTSLLLISG